MVLMDLQSDLARCVMCGWFNEWHRFGERDQLALSYVLFAMGLTPPDEAAGAETDTTDPSPLAHGRSGSRAPRPSRHRGVYLWPRHEHWNWKRSKGEPKQKPYVRYVGHGGCIGASGHKLKPLPLGCK